MSYRKKIMRVALSSACLLPAILGACPVAAQTEGGPPVPSEPVTDVSDDDIVVTANRREQLVSKVPASITVLTQEGMDAQGVRAIDDIARLTPGVTFKRGYQATSSISIRGIASSVGAATTGIYIDDTPIQIRALGNSAANTYPVVFDLSRVEILRGPQGTLFGAGSQGGTVRFISQEPSLGEFSGYGRAEVSTTKNGGSGYEIGAAVGGPLVDNVLGFRASAYFRRDAGWIDKVIGTTQILSPNGSAGPNNSINFVRTGVGYADSNWSETTAIKAALLWEPNDGLKVTPSVFYQNIYNHDALTNFWVGLSDYEAGDFATPMFIGSVDAGHFALPDAPDYEPSKDRFILPALKIEQSLGWADLISNTSYFKRNHDYWSDYTALYSRIYAGRQIPSPGDRTYTIFGNDQKTFSQEIRLQSADTESRLKWLVGAFYSDGKQVSRQEAKPNFLTLLPAIGAAVNNGAPFGPGYSAFLNFYGIDLVNGSSYIHRLQTKERQIAGFGQLDFELFDGLTLTAGVRVANTRFSYGADYNGPINNQNQPRGLACTPGTGTPGAPACVPVVVGAFRPGEGPFAPAFVSVSNSTKETPITPKFGISYQVDPDNLVYASAAKGYRIGGAQARVPATCNDQLISLGFVDSQGRATSPDTYKSDSVWSYEIGTKNKLLGGRMQVATSAYYIKWSDIQSSVFLNTCANTIIANLGKATSRGADIQLQFNPLDALTLGASVAYNHASFDDATIIGGRTIYTDGSAIPNSGAPWTIYLSGQYDVDISQNAEGYARVDYTYTSRHRRTGATDPGTISYDPKFVPLESTSLVNLRVGAKIDDFDLSFFVNNLLDAHPSLFLERVNNQPIYTDNTFRPRTLGVTLSSQF